MICRRDPRSGRQEPAGAGHHADQADGEDLTDYLAENEVRVRYLHGDPPIERIEIIQDLRLGEYDVCGGQPAARAWTCRR